MNAIPICCMVILVFNVKGLRINPSIRWMNICPPSSPGMGNTLINARFTLIRAINVKKGIQPASAVCPANCAIMIGPPKSETDAEPEPNILKLVTIIPKLAIVLNQPKPNASLKVISKKMTSGAIPMAPSAVSYTHLTLPTILLV